MKKDLDGHEYEYECAKLLKKRGFSKVYVTKGSGDQGVDVIAYANGKKYGIQCKYYSSPVGNSAIQEVYSGAKYYNCDIAVVMTNATFTESAIDLASKLGVLLWENNAVKVQQPFYIRLLKPLGIITILFGLLTIWGAFTFDDIKYRPFQQIESIVIFLSGLLTLLQYHVPEIGILPTIGYGIIFILSILFDILCNRAIYSYSFLFLLCAIFTFVCTIFSCKKQNYNNQ